MVDIRNRNRTSSISVADDQIDDLEWYCHDPDAPTPTDDGLSVVDVNDVHLYRILTLMLYHTSILWLILTVLVLTFMNKPLP